MNKLVLVFGLVISNFAFAANVTPVSGRWDDAGGIYCVNNFDFSPDYSTLYIAPLDKGGRYKCRQAGTIHTESCNYLESGELQCGNGKFISDRAFLSGGKIYRPL